MLLTYFYSKNCSVCENMAPNLEKFAKEVNAQVKKIDIDSEVGNKLADKMGVEFVPHTIIKNGECTKTMTGYATENDLKKVTEGPCGR